MQRCLVFLVLSATLALAAPGAAAVQVTTAVELVQAVAAAPPGQVIELAAGTYVLDQSLVVPAGVTLVGAGVDATIVTGDAGWLPGVDALPSQETPGAYLLNLLSGAVGIEISQMTFTAPNLHGAIYAFDADDLEIFDVRFEGFRWAAIRAFLMSQFNVHDCVFVDAGGQVPGRTAGAIYADFTRDSTFWNNHIYRTPAHPYNFFGIKGEQIRFSRIHHNTIEVSFSLEFPFRNDEAVEIDHNYFLGVVSLPKFAGGPVYTDSFSYDVHHNVFQTAYAIELARNQMTVRNNLFLFDVYDDGGNLMSNFGSEPVPGPLVFADNLVQNPGRGVLWTRGPHDQLTIRNNHVRADTLTRVSGFFGINGLSDMATVSIRDNIIENTADNPRPLVRNVESTLAQIENNMLINVSDVGSYANPTTSAVAGPTAPLAFSAGVDGHFQVDGWNVSGLLPRHEAEDFTAADGTALYPTQDLGGGFKVGSISRDDTLDYTVVAPRTTTYRVAFRVSTPKDARAFEVLRDGVVLDTVTFDDTGGFEDWTTVFGEIDLIAGPQTLQLRALESRWDLNWFAIDRDEILAPVTIPAQIEAEDYAVMRGIQTEPSADVGGGENIGFVDDEDLLGYEIDVPWPGSYQLDLRVASNSSATNGGEIWVLNRTGRLAVAPIPYTGGWQTWTTVSVPLTLPAGEQDLRIFAKRGRWNLNWLALGVDPAVVSPMPYFVEAEDFAESFNIGVEPTTDVGGGENVGWMRKTSWMRYALAVPAAGAGSYEVDLRVASRNSDRQFALYQGDRELGVVTVPNTGDWQTWTTVTLPVTLELGLAPLEVRAIDGGWNLNWLNVRPAPPAAP